jgi:hypothetical protein
LYIGSTHVLVRQYKPDMSSTNSPNIGHTVRRRPPSTVYVGLLAAESMKTADLSELENLLRRRIGMLGRSAPPMVQNYRVRHP